ncbi:uncharacterized protein TM35_000292530 [Trypanosoma theileri]|uniref:J domain-containing protein n=1 Tax=Trypanosoma theileri TaxID=67003 RepID=A0A1X0NP38_9TRYP|nr:uncharacterized protein TM35_000292530 [Trypanosoma theileri]ORC86371.1 hypothetical protein TM35_000292530 [Trypanosoma theileri]
MEAVAERYFNIGDMKSAATFYGNLMMLHPRYVKMARICRVLADPSAVPLPHRYADVVEALLEPSITPEALFGADTTPADVNKAYQRWTLLVHPDKNPYPRAGDAFNRLVSLRTNALELVSARKKRPNSEPIGREDHDRRGNRQHKKGGSPAAPGRSSENNTSSLRAAEIDMTISELKKVQVTLKSLKRKNIDDSELPELSVSLRGVRERRFLTHPTSPLASTAPDVPTWDLASDARTSPYPTTTNTTANTATTTSTTAPTTTTTSSSSTTTATHSNNRVVPSPPPSPPNVSGEEAPSRVSTAKPSRQPPPQTGTVRGEQNTDKVSERVQSQQKVDVKKKAGSAGKEGQTIKNDAKQPQEVTIDKNRSTRKTATDEGTKVATTDAQSRKSDTRHSQETIVEKNRSHRKTDGSENKKIISKDVQSTKREPKDSQETIVEKNRSRRRSGAGENTKNQAKETQDVVGEKNRSRRKTDVSENAKVTATNAQITKDEPQEPQEEITEDDHSCRKTDANEKRNLSSMDDQCVDNDVQQLQLDVPLSQTVSTVSDEVSFVDVARESINGLIRDLEEIKLNRVPLRLNCDLSFAAYEREKLQREASCSEKKSSL